MQEGWNSVEWSWPARVGVPLLLALISTLCVFLLLPLLAWFSSDVQPTYRLRSVDTLRASVQPPAVSLPQPVVSERAFQRPEPKFVASAPFPRTPLPSVPTVWAVPSPSLGLPERMDWAESWRGGADLEWSVADVDERPMPLAQMKPVYPLRARHAKVEGFVTLEMMVDEQGRVQQPVVTDAQPPGYFEQAALRSASAWRFKPAVKDGVAVPVRVVQKLTFTLDGQTP